MDTSNSPDCTPIDETSFLAEYAQKEGYTETESGLIYRIIEEGDGEIPQIDQYVFVTFKGKLVSGEQFTPTANSDELSFFPLGDGVLPGIREGLEMMREGATYELVLPTELGYNNNPPAGSPIRCGAVLIYELTLDSFLRDVVTFLNENLDREDIEVTGSGLQYRIIEEGDSEAESPNPQSDVSVNYTGKLTNDYIFDQSTEGNPAQFNVAGVIDGFSEGLQLMKPGAKYEFFLPPNLGYGNNPPTDPQTRALVIPPNVVLVFEVELLEVL
ncbi:MAG: FKBP-type peptidyl-prolyl cis-trans isomerase [Balneolaceae bacterium]